jgi:hypothetical protein
MVFLFVLEAECLFHPNTIFVTKMRVKFEKSGTEFIGIILQHKELRTKVNT